MRGYLKELLATFPEFRRSGPYVYRRPIRNLLVGYLVEFPPSGPRLRALRFPLYERIDFIHLDYSPELAKFRPDGTPRDHTQWVSAETARSPLGAEELQAINPRKMSREEEHAFAQRLISLIRQDLERLDQREDLAQFSERLRSRSELEPNWKKTLALTLVMQGELREAHALLIDLLGASDLVELSSTERDDLEQTLRSIELGPAAARNYRLEVITEMRDRFSLESD